MNLATTLKAEFTRIVRKEVRVEVSTLKKSMAVHRSAIAALKRQIVELQKQNKELAKSAGRVPAKQVVAEEVPTDSLRFRPAGLASHRKRLGLSAQAMGRLLNVSGQTVTAWETGKTMPRRGQLPAIAKVRKMGKRELAALMCSD